MTAEDRALWFVIRRALLLVIDAIERRIGVAPRTSELRRICEAHRLTSARDGVDNCSESWYNQVVS